MEDETNRPFIREVDNPGYDLSVFATTNPTDRVLHAANEARPPEGEIVAADKWIQLKVREYQGGLGSIVVELTLPLAWAFLSRNANNRPILRKNLDQFIQDIKAGKMAINGERIIVSKEGWLNDGQHRCLARILTQSTFQSEVGWGYDRDTRFTLGGGARRSAGDRLGMAGLEGGRPMAAVAIAFWQYIRLNRLGSTQRPTESQILELCEQNPDMRDCFEAFPYKKPGTQIHGNVPLWLAYYVFNHCDPDRAKEFFALLRDGYMLDRKSPILHARNRILESMGSKGYKVGERWELLVRAWNHWYVGNELEALKVTGRDVPLPTGWPAAWPLPGAGRFESEQFFEARTIDFSVKQKKRLEAVLTILRKSFSAVNGEFTTLMVRKVLWSSKLKVSKSAVYGIISELDDEGWIDRMGRGHYRLREIQKKGMGVAVTENGADAISSIAGE